MKCMSYTLGNYREECLTGNGIEGPNAEIIFNQINGLFCVVEERKHSWEAFSIRSMPSTNKIGWWSREEFWEYILPYFKFEKESLLKPWFDEWILHSVNKLKSIKERISAQLSELEKSFVPGTAGFDQKLLVTAFTEVAVVVDVTRKAREATGLIESGGPVAVMLEEILDSLSQYYEGLIEDMDSPNVKRYIALAVSLGFAPPGHFQPPASAPAPAASASAASAASASASASATTLELDEIKPDPTQAPDLPLPPAHPHNKSASELEAAWKEYCLKLGGPYMRYFRDVVVNQDCAPDWRAASMADPLNMQREKITESQLRLCIKPLVGKLVCPALVDEMVLELPEYEIACRQLGWRNLSHAERVKKIESFWCSQEHLPAWTSFTRLVTLLQPTSKCAEHSFSLLDELMEDNQPKSSKSLLEISLMLRFNRGSNKSK